MPTTYNDPTNEKDHLKTYITDNPLQYQGAMAIFSTKMAILFSLQESGNISAQKPKTKKVW